MKRNLLTLVLVFFVAFAVNAQVTTFFDDFSGGDLSNFTVIDNDGGGHTWEYNATEGVGGTDCARLHWESAAHDDYLISPQITVGANTYFSVDAQNDASGFHDSCYVKISTTTADVASFTVTLDTISTSDGSGTDAYTTFTYDLSAYDGEDIYIAIVGFTTDQFYFNIDNFNVYVAYNVTFNVDMTDSIASGYFVAGTDTLSVTGDFAGWTVPGTDAGLFMADGDADGIYTFSTVLANGDYSYKYFKNLGWGNGEWDGDPNRTFTVADADVVLNDYFGDINNHVGINEISSNGIKVFPNPSNGVFNINVDNNYNLEVFDITGRVINTKTLTGNTSIELNSAGVYFLRFSNEEGSYTQKVIVK